MKPSALASPTQVHKDATISQGLSHQQNLKPDWQQRSHLGLAKGSQKLYRQMEMIPNNNNKKKR